MPKYSPNVHRRNVAVGAAVICFVGVMASLPYVIRKQAKKSLYDSEEGLTGSQIQRGAYMNSGSKDVGRDPDWDKETRKWKGKYNKPDGS